MNQLKKLRKDQGKSLEEISQLLDVSRQVYLNMENGKRKLKESELIRLSDYFQVSIDYLLGLTDIKDMYPKRKEK